MRSAGALWLLQQALQPMFEADVAQHRVAERLELAATGDPVPRSPVGMKGFARQFDRAEVDSVLAEAEGLVEATRLVRWQAPDRGAWP